MSRSNSVPRNLPAPILEAPSRRPDRLAVFACLLAALALLGVAASHAAPCAGSQIQGVVFHDFNADGSRSNGNVETGIAGGVVTVFSTDGTSTSCESLADGSYAVDAPSGGFPVRVEVTLPSGGGFDALRPGAAGLTSVFFVDAAGSGFDVGFNVPVDFCQANPDVLSTCYLQGDPLTPGSDFADGDAIISVDYDRTVTEPAHLAVGSQVGAVWGLAYQKSSQQLLASAVLRRHSGWGPLGPGGIYRLDFTVDPPAVSNFVDLATLGVDVGTDPRTQPGEDPPGNGATGNEPGLDNLTYEEIGKVGIGDIDLDEDNGILWAMSLGDRRLYAMDIGFVANVPTAATAFTLPDPGCVDGTFRPWAVKVYRGRVYIGGVCSNEAIDPYPPVGGFTDFPNLVGYVYSMDPADGVFSLDLTVPLNYVKGCAGGATGCQWYPWTDLSTASQVTTPALPSHPSPIFSDIEFSDDGDMILGLTDRTGFQYGNASPLPNGSPTDTTVVTAFAGGDMLRADFDAASGIWTLESGGVVGGVSGAGAGNLQGPGGGEFYSASTAGFHFELSQGGFAVLRGSNSFVGSAMDPVVINSGGLLWMHELGATPGAFLGGFTLYDITTPSGFRKGAGVGDVELRCDEAPIELGNRVWCDAPVTGQLGDGVQSAGDPDVPLGGVTVHLSCDGGMITASTTTQADGTYLFGPGNVVGGIPPGALCTLSVDTLDPALGQCNQPTLADAGGADPGSDLRDSDGTDPDRDGIVGATVVVGGPGANDHSIDFGFVVAPAIGSLGDTVWCDGLDGFGNGLFDAGEGINGVTVELFEDTNCDDGADGSAIDSRTTSGDGQYLFEDLIVGPPGDPACYVVRVDPTDAALGACVIPVTPLETSSDLDVDNPEDLDNDFAFLEPCDDSDGDNLCNESCDDDRDGDGVPDCADVDPQGFFYCEETGEILSGGFVDVAGPGSVTIFEDGSSGRYSFLTDGTPGLYTMLVTPPEGYPLSDDCLDQGLLDPTGEADPLALGAGALGDLGYLTSSECINNPFYLTFDLEPGDPFIINNNIPLASCRVPPTEIPTASHWGLIVLALLLATGGSVVLRRARRHGV